MSILLGSGARCLDGCAGVWGRPSCFYLPSILISETGTHHHHNLFHEWSVVVSTPFPVHMDKIIPECLLNSN